MLSTLSVWELGVGVMLALLPFLGLRYILVPRYVDVVSPHDQTVRQFRLDFTLFLLAGISLAVFNHYYLGFSFLSSGTKLALSLATIGFFASLDLSLEKERALIRRANELGQRLHPPDKLSPLTRKFTMVATCTLLLVAVSITLLFLRDIAWMAEQLEKGEQIGLLRREVLVETVFALSVLLALTIRVIISYSRNLQLLFQNETNVLEQVSRGDLSGSVPVLTRDEFGFIAGHTNNMIEGLRDRVRMLEGLVVAREVQQNLLPASAPQVSGVSISGRSHYSDETGGDFFDFYDNTGPQGEHVGLVVGDVSGHGVGSAMLMATARAMFRLRMGQGCELAQCVMDVNNQLARDLFGSGQFMTLFALLLHNETGELTICSAGHDPGIVYNPATQRFSELVTTGLPLGVEAQWQYTSSTRESLAAGEVLVLGTDGIWETQSPEGEMFGKQRLREAIAEYAHTRQKKDAEPGETLEDRILQTVRAFSGSDKQQDDITLVVLEGLRR